MQPVMLNGKQKRYLRGLGNTLEPIIQVGKGGLVPGVIRQADDALEARELIKGRVLPNCPDGPKEISEALAGAVEAALVQVIGRTFLLYRPSSKKPEIELP